MGTRNQVRVDFKTFQNFGFVGVWPEFLGQGSVAQSVVFNLGACRRRWFLGTPLRTCYDVNPWGGVQEFMPPPPPPQVLQGILTQAKVPRCLGPGNVHL